MHIVNPKLLRPQRIRRRMSPGHMQMLYNTVWFGIGAKTQKELAAAFGHRLDRDSDEAANFSRRMRYSYSSHVNTKGNDSGSVSTGKFHEMCRIAANNISDPVYKKLTLDLQLFADLIERSAAELWLLPRKPGGIIANERFYIAVFMSVDAPFEAIKQVMALNLDYDSLVLKLILAGHPEPVSKRPAVDFREIEKVAELFESNEKDLRSRWQAIEENRDFNRPFSAKSDWTIKDQMKATFDPDYLQH